MALSITAALHWGDVTGLQPTAAFPLKPVRVQQGISVVQHFVIQNNPSLEELRRLDLEGADANSTNQRSEADSGKWAGVGQLPRSGFCAGLEHPPMLPPSTVAPTLGSQLNSVQWW